MTTINSLPPLADPPPRGGPSPEWIVDQHERFGDVFAARLKGAPTAVCGGLTGTKALFKSERGRMVVYNTPLVHALFGQAVFNLEGDDHIRARRLLNPALNGPVLHTFAPVLFRLAEGHARSWGCGGQDLYTISRRVTMDACATILIGVPVNSTAHANLIELFDEFVKGTEVPTRQRHVSPSYWHARRARARLSTLFTTLPIADEGAASAPRSIRAQLCSTPTGGCLSDHLLALLIAARETTASLLTWLLIELASNNALGDAVRHEAWMVTQEPGMLTDEDAIPILRAVLSEAERRHSPNLLSTRTASVSVELGEYRVPAGWRLAYSPAANHLMPDVYPTPLSFRPDRFLPPSGQSAAGLLTFGRGLHACPGKSLAELIILAVAAAVCAEYRLLLDERFKPQVRYTPVKAPIGPVVATIVREQS